MPWGSRCRSSWPYRPRCRPGTVCSYANRSAFERARRLEAIVFDKTGTLTEGRFGVTDVVSLDGSSEDEILRLAAGLESQSEHPIAAGVVGGARERQLSIPTPKDFRSIPGKGAQASLGGRQVKVVSPGYLTERGFESSDSRVRELADQGKTVVYLLVDDQLQGAIALADVIRPESREALKGLKEMGIQVMMLTGDSKAVAEWVANELQLDDFFAEVLPHQKAAKIKEVKSRGLTVAMTGDGVNDAPALVEADVGIANGGGNGCGHRVRGHRPVRSDPRDVLSIVGLARATYRKMVHNLWWATGYNVVAIPLAAGTILMSLSTMIVAINARFLRMPRTAAP